jgi:MFS family permease
MTTAAVNRSATVLDINGKRLSPAAIRRGLMINIAAGALGNSWAALALGMPLIMFMERVGVAGVVIGLMAMVQNLAMVMQIPSALVAERVASRSKFWFWVVMPHRLLWYVPAFLALYYGRDPRVGWYLLGVVTISSLLASAGTASWYSWMMDLIPKRVRGRFWSLRQSVVMLANLLSMVLAGLILDARWGGKDSSETMVGFAVVYLVAATLGCADILLHMSVPEPQRRQVNLTGRVLESLREPFRNRDFLWVTLAFGMWNFSLGFARFGEVYLKRECGVQYSELSALFISTALGCVVASYVWSRIMDRIGNRTACLLMFAIAPVFALAWWLAPVGEVTLAFLPGQPVVPKIIVTLFVVNFFAAAFYSCTGLTQITLCSASTTPGNRTLAMAVHWTAVGVLASLGPVLGGMVMDLWEKTNINLVLPFGLPLSYQHVLVLIHMLLTWFVALPLLRKVQKSQGELPVSTFMGNPLRVMGLIQNIMLFDGAVTAKERARAVTQAGVRRLSYAVDDLRGKLDDPSMLVRQNAAAALGRIGTDAAVRVLLDKLADPHSDLAPTIARALRKCRRPDVVDALIAKMKVGDQESIREIALTLGCLGDRRAVEPLLEILRSSDNPQLLSSSGEALASLDEKGAVFEILARMRDSGNPMLRRSLAVAAGDLLGGRGRFYALLVQEEKEPGGAAFSESLGDLRSFLKKAGKDAKVRSRCAECLDQFEDAYAEGDLQQAGEQLIAGAIQLASLHLGLTAVTDREVLLDILICRDAHLGAGVWLCKLLELDGDRLDVVYILLVLHFFRQWCLRQQGSGRGV